MIGVWAFVRALYKALMAISLPLLIVIAIVAVAAVPPTWQWAMAKHQLRQAQRTIKVQGAELLRVHGEVAACTANLNNVTNALETQNVAVDQLRAESAAATQRANAAVQRAQEQARVYRAKIDRLQRATPSADVCASARTLITEALKEERP